MAKALAEKNRRLKLTLRGAVQGVGFRPFVFRLATELGLAGWVNNSAQGVFIEVEGEQSKLDQFRARLETEKPARSFIQSLEASWLDPAGYEKFEIRESAAGGSKTALVLPDIATCPDCLHEIFDPTNRRYHYPFTNCTHCGPRFSIIEALPYDRANTSMKRFAMCPQCRAEYENPLDRRFHAQPNAYPVCGPRLELWDRTGAVSATCNRGTSALEEAAKAIRSGKILAVKGLGGFHLMVAAHDDRAVRRLRERKHREEKPFALMFPSLAGVRGVCEVSPIEERLLCSPECPIVLLRRSKTPDVADQAAGLSPSLAPGNPNLGALLPYTPLHHLLLSMLDFPVVATSGNVSDEPICTDDDEALERLGDIADLFLVHNRPIVRHVDDSIVRVMAGREMVLRRARGFAPLPLALLPPSDGAAGPSVLAVGAQLKNAVALTVNDQAFISQHIGDLETEPAYAAFRRVIADFQRLYETQPAIVVADEHPDYLSTRFAQEFTMVSRPGELPQLPLPRLVRVQHHVAHVFACMAENEVEPPVLGVSWDGTGYGLDGTVWGGEFFLVTDRAVERVAHLRPFRLPGGERAVKEPRRTLLGLLYEAFGAQAFTLNHLEALQGFSASELASLRTMLERKVNSPLTSSVGRLFDAVASLAGLCQRVRFEGQAAMGLEFCRETSVTDEFYPLTLANPSPGDPHSPLHLDWLPLVEAILADLKRGIVPAMMSTRFHNGLAEAIVAVARQVGQERIVLSGGCFQNRYLTERAISRLQAEGFRPYWHQRVPPNDGGICLGQVVAAMRHDRLLSPRQAPGQPG